ncbi:hypothetical protein FRC12_024140 [Ceratobasidium sp. 428]|nr:hypothetical protein FRC12_024140 [Ceratobasidium sp. 428]
MFKDDSRDILGGYPVLIGEIGVPFDMDSKRSYGLDGSGKYIGDYTSQTRALDCSLNGADGKNVMNWTLWTYCPDNSHVWGDGWNLEDLSLWSSDDADRDRDTGQSFIVESSQADLLGRDRRNDGSLVPVEDQDARNRSESTLGTLETLRVGTMTHIATQPQPRAPPTLNQPFTCPEPDPVEQALRISADRLYDFVTVGARGVGALARPWPIATVGVPTCLEFDISKAQFEMRVKVSHADRIWGGREPIKMPGEFDEDEEDELGTEVYIPLVHFAADSAFEGNVQVCPEETPKVPQTTLAPGYRDDEDDDTLVSHSRADSKGSGDIPAEGEFAPKKQRRGTTATLRRARANTVGTLAPILAAPTSSAQDDSSSTPIPLGTQSIMGTLVESDMLALEVEVSEGRWIVDGQVLRWWYDAPSEGEPDKEITLKLRRKGGPIKGVMRGFSGMDGAASVRSAQGGLWETLCPPGGCVIA